jgi:hypothetical protein
MQICIYLCLNSDGKTYSTSWLLISIAKELSNHNEVFSLYPSSSFDIYLNDDLSSHNEYKDGDQNTFISIWPIL